MNACLHYTAEGEQITHTVVRDIHATTNDLFERCKADREKDLQVAYKTSRNRHAHRRIPTILDKKHGILTAETERCTST